MKATTFHGCTIVFVRHGQTEWNVERRYQGQKDSPLTNVGEQGAIKLGQRISKDSSLQSISAVYTSDLKRCVHTTQLIMLNSYLADSGIPLYKDKRLREMNFGTLEGAHQHEITSEQNKFLENWKVDSKAPGGGESRLDVAERMCLCIHEIAKKHSGETVLVVSHGASLSAWLDKEMCISSEPTGTRYQNKVQIKNTALNIATLNTGPKPFCLTTLGDTSHQEIQNFSASNAKESEQTLTLGLWLLGIYALSDLRR